jgi:hypothetical protein
MKNRVSLQIYYLQILDSTAARHFDEAFSPGYN